VSPLEPPAETELFLLFLLLLCSSPEPSIRWVNELRANKIIDIYYIFRLDLVFASILLCVSLFLQIRMGAISQTNVNFAGSHCGVSIGEDGPSQMGLEDIAMFRTIPGKIYFLLPATI